MNEHTIVVDLGLGDAGKGVTVDLLCAAGGYGAVVRANGGAQAAHNVITPGGKASHLLPVRGGYARPERSGPHPPVPLHGVGSVRAGFGGRPPGLPRCGGRLGHHPRRRSRSARSRAEVVHRLSLPRGEAVRITPGHPPDLERQAALTRRLKGALPMLAPIPGDPAEAISHALGLPLAAVFAGSIRVDAHVPTRCPPRTGTLPRRLP